MPSTTFALPSKPPSTFPTLPPHLLQQLTTRQARLLASASIVALSSIVVNRVLAKNASKYRANARRNSKGDAIPPHLSTERVVLPFTQQSIIQPPKQLQEHIDQATFELHRKTWFKHVAMMVDEEKSKVKKSAPGVNPQFLRQLRAIMQIIIPKLQSKEVLLIILHSVALIARTWLSVVVASLDGRIVRDLVAANGKAFARGLMYWFAIAIPATYTNSMIRYLQSKLSIAFRTRLTRYVHDLYLDEKLAYYKVVNLDGRIVGVDQFITTDIAKFCDTLSSLYSNLAKPLLDTIIFNYQLTRTIGLAGMCGLFINYMVTARLLRAVTPSFGKMAAIEAKLEGDFRHAHTRLITNAEEISFYNGAELEHAILNRAYTKLIKHINSIYKIRIAYNMFEDFLIKYVWSAFGLGMCSIPVFWPQLAGGVIRGADDMSEHERVGDRTRGFITSKRLMLSLADAGGRMMYSYKEIAELAGFTSRVYNLISILLSLHASEYAPSPQKANDIKEGVDDNPHADHKPYLLDDLHGELVLGLDGIAFSHVPIVTPNPGSLTGGDLLVDDLSVKIGPGEHLMITGPNGVGKTAVARVISGLWPLFEGEVGRPAVGDIFYIPQRPYLSLGTLRDQIIYPHSVTDMRRAGRTDAELQKILEIVHLEYIPSREGGFETVKEWKDVFSGGEKQRMGMARLFYHHPKYAMLDECTSAVSSDVEGGMYNYAKDISITLITISHRPSLFKYHTHLLRLTGEHGQWTFTQLEDDKEAVSYEAETKQLEQELKQVEALKARLNEVNTELDGHFTAKQT